MLVARAYRVLYDESLFDRFGREHHAPPEEPEVVRRRVERRLARVDEVLGPLDEAERLFVDDLFSDHRSGSVDDAIAGRFGPIDRDEVRDLDGPSSGHLRVVD